ncbi:hypothetical protein [Velocimicrobium porci]|uniref:Uncharacterized protein n=1 Tax=Velocimicrobium porci TaxID=2606634 RepID=A0A6L5Y3U8_9FIRM|nr:hypothetical protein [Velocimicrobium porci]MSS64823.1 hypothetical protein [Velocimicrobium porci]
MEKGYIPTPNGAPLIPVEDPLADFDEVGDPLTEEEIMGIRQLSNYNENNKAAPDNNIFFEARSNPLSSKGN